MAKDVRYFKIRKPKAKKLYDLGYPVILVPCNANIYSPWITGVTVLNTEEKDFDRVVNSFEFYNCNTNELGKYAAYYIEEVEILNLKENDEKHITEGNTEKLIDKLLEEAKKREISIEAVGNGVIFGIYK